MQTTLLTALVIAVVMAAMAVGVIFAKRPLQGSCGGSGEACACSRAERMRCRIKRTDEREGNSKND
jgi:hypothetical protein